ncbi:response regulator [Ideonella sp.]|uniref:response regulator n=1 Tax=Ideonella sp. TaxID=1929293 RepID=UPI0035B3DA38
MSSAATPPSFSTAEVAQRLGVSAPTVQRWVDQGYIKAWKTVGGHRRIDAASVESFLASQQLQAVARPAGKTPARPGPSVLVVDDNPDDRDLLSAVVEATLPDAAIQVVENGFQALVAIGQVTPDILLTDVVMPHMNGLEMLRELRQARTPGPRAIVVVTSLGPERLAALGGLPAGVGLVHKPVAPDGLAAALRACLEPPKINE